ncbi:MAG: hypothetical protein JW751_18050 [Polyangiaceae bacterium]|nr:hypothetical protein [Polyangiaceae bacterium]
MDVGRRYEPLELDLDWEMAPITERSPQLILPPARGELEESGRHPIDDRWSLEWIDDIEEPPASFLEDEVGTQAGTPDAKRRPTLRAAPPPPSLAAVAASGVRVESLIPSPPPPVSVTRSSAMGRPTFTVVRPDSRRRAG